MEENNIRIVGSPVTTITRPRWVKYVAVLNLILIVLLGPVLSGVALYAYMGAIFFSDNHSGFIAISIALLLLFYSVGLTIDIYRKSFQEKYLLNFNAKDKYFTFLPIILIMLAGVLIFIYV